MHFCTAQFLTGAGVCRNLESAPVLETRRTIKRPKRIRDDDYDEDEFEPRAHKYHPSLGPECMSGGGNWGRVEPGIAVHLSLSDACCTIPLSHACCTIPPSGVCCTIPLSDACCTIPPFDVCFRVTVIPATLLSQALRTQCVCCTVLCACLVTCQARAVTLCQPGRECLAGGK